MHTATGTTPGERPRLEYLDATRAFALVLGIVFHASLSFLPFFIGWAVQDISTSGLVAMFVLVSHSFRMELFFLLAGFFGFVTLRSKGLRSFVGSRLVRLGVPFAVGWFVLRPLIVSGWLMGSASLRGDYDFWAGIRGGIQMLTSSLPSGMFTGTHLWFLYYLGMITAAVIVVRGALIGMGSFAAALMRRADWVVAWIVNSRWGVAVLVIPTAAALLLMRAWGMDTPDQSLKPHVPVFIVYAGFFGFGWMLARQSDLMTRFVRLSVWRGIGLIVGIAGCVLLAAIEANPNHAQYAQARLAFSVSYALMMWSLVLVTLGVFSRWFRSSSATDIRAENRGTERGAHPRLRAFSRYVADSSYWLYLAHLPIVVWLQVAFAEVEWPWSVKLVAISAISLAVLFISYDLFVRATFVGWILNGRRQARVIFRLPSRQQKIAA